MIISILTVLSAALLYFIGMMAETNATAGFGTLLKVGDGSGNYTVLAEVKDITGPGFTHETEEVTHHQSPGRFKEKIATLIDGGEVTFNMNYIMQNATQSISAGLAKDLIDHTLRNIKIIFSDAGSTEWILPCFVTGWEPRMPVGSVFDCSVTLEVARQPSLN